MNCTSCPEALAAGPHCALEPHLQVPADRATPTPANQRARGPAGFSANTSNLPGVSHDPARAPFSPHKLPQELDPGQGQIRTPLLRDCPPPMTHRTGHSSPVCTSGSRRRRRADGAGLLVLCALLPRPFLGGQFPSVSHSRVARKLPAFAHEQPRPNARRPVRSEQPVSVRTMSGGPRSGLCGAFNRAAQDPQLGDSLGPASLRGSSTRAPLRVAGSSPRGQTPSLRSSGGRGGGGAGTE